MWLLERGVGVASLCCRAIAGRRGRRLRRQRCGVVYMNSTLTPYGLSKQEIPEWDSEKLQITARIRK